MDGKAIPHEVVRSTNIFFIVYVLIFASSIFLIAFDDFDLITNFTAGAATFNNIGPGLELVGPTGNFGMFSWLSKLPLLTKMKQSWMIIPRTSPDYRSILCRKQKVDGHYLDPVFCDHRIDTFFICHCCTL